MTNEQKQALQTLVDRLNAERSLNVTVEGVAVEEQASGKLHVMVHESWPVISIGKKGGFDMPEIASYPQVKGGKTALDACVDGDKYLAKKLGRQAKAVAPVAEAPKTEEQPAAEEKKEEAVAETATA